MTFKLIDCFIFYNELQLLLFRLEELYEIVDYFVLVESTVTFTGNAKPLYFEQHKELFHKYIDKIIHIVEDDKLQTNNPWHREEHQRRCIDRGIKKIDLDHNDLILISDLDEIADVNTLDKIKQNGLQEGKALLQDLYYYNITTRVLQPWFGAKIVPYRIYVTSDPEKIRVNYGYSKMESGGWHFSYFGDKNFIENKIKNFSHQEFNKKGILDNIYNSVKDKKDLFGRSNPLKYIAIKDNTYLPKNYKMLLFSSFIIDNPNPT